MGYAHMWRRAVELPKDRFQAAATACAKLCLSSGVQLTGGLPDYPYPTFTEDRINFNGVGAMGHETFIMLREIAPNKKKTPDAEGRYFQFCKTLKKPYDVCVTGCLLIIAHYFSHNIPPIVIISDGTDENWLPAKQLYKRVFGEEPSCLVLEKSEVT